jgi:hypothetical protein
MATAGRNNKFRRYYMKIPRIGWLTLSLSPFELALETKATRDMHPDDFKQYRFGPVVMSRTPPSIVWSAGNTTNPDYDRDWKPVYPVVDWNHPEHPKPEEAIHADWENSKTPHEVIRKYLHPSKHDLLSNIDDNEANYIIWLMTDDGDCWDLSTNSFESSGYHTSVLDEYAAGNRNSEKQVIGAMWGKLCGPEHTVH